MSNWSLSTFPSEDEVTYKLEAYKYNYMLIFSYFSNDFSIQLSDTGFDVNCIKLAFKEFEFEIEEHKVLKRAEIIDKLNILRSKDFTEYGCVAVVVLTHGDYGGTLMAKDGPYHEKDIIEYFKSNTNPTLITKPKILIVQACRTRLVPKAARNSVPTSSGSSRQPDLSYTLNLEPDILILHSYYPGDFSDSKEFLGSWLIQLLCDNIARHSPILDLESIVTNVKRKITLFSLRHNTPEEYDFEGQIPVSISTLTRRLFFRKYKDYIEYNANISFKKIHEIFKFEKEDF